MTLREFFTPLCYEGKNIGGFPQGYCEVPFDTLASHLGWAFAVYSLTKVILYIAKRCWDG